MSAILKYDIRIANHFGDYKNLVCVRHQIVNLRVCRDPNSKPFDVDCAAAANVGAG